MKVLGYLFITLGLILGCGSGLMLAFCLLGAFFGELDNDYSFRYLLMPSLVFMASGFIFSFGYGLVYGENPLISELNYLGLDKLDVSYIKKEDLELDLGHGLHIAFKIVPLFIALGFLISFMKTSNAWDVLFSSWFLLFSFLLFNVRRKCFFCKYENVWTFAYCLGKKVVVKISFDQPYINKIYVDHTDYRDSSSVGYKENRVYELEVHSSKGYLVLFESANKKEVEERFKLLDHYYTT